MSHTVPSAANPLFLPVGRFVPVFGRFSEQMPEKRGFVPEMGCFSEQTSVWSEQGRANGACEWLGGQPYTATGALMAGQGS